MLLKYWCSYESPGILVKCWVRFSKTGGHLRCCSSNTLPGDADVADPQTTRGVERSCPREHSLINYPSWKAWFPPGGKGHSEHHCLLCLPNSWSSSASYTQDRADPADAMCVRASISEGPGPGASKHQEQEKDPHLLGLFNSNSELNSWKYVIIISSQTSGNFIG